MEFGAKLRFPIQFHIHIETGTALHGASLFGIDTSGSHDMLRHLQTSMEYLWIIFLDAPPVGYVWRTFKTQSSPGTWQMSCLPMR